MKSFTVSLSLLAFLLVVITFSCEKVYLTEPPEVILDTTVIYSFADTIQPIFDEKCVSCHGGGIPLNLTPGNSYNALINGGYVEPDTAKASQSLIYTKLLTGSHENRATAAEKALILMWIKQGAQNN